jgi:hypothetical protein
MNNPINESPLTGQHTVKPQQHTPASPYSTGEDANVRQTAELSEDRVSLSSTTAQEAADARISTLDAAHRAIEKLKQQIDANPDAVLSAQQGLNTDTAASALRQAAA